jgi:hypothetical protein
VRVMVEVGNMSSSQRYQIAGRILCLSLTWTVLAGCGASSGRLSTHETPPTSAPSGAPTSRSSTSDTKTGGAYPDTFVATAVRGSGIAVYSSMNGGLVRTLTTGDRDGAPFFAGSRQQVYFIRPGPFGSCRYGLWRVPVTGGTVSRVATVGTPAGGVAVSGNARLLAYLTSRDPCNIKAGPDLVVVQDLITGRRHGINGDLSVGSSLAWSPDRSTLAVVTPVGLTGADRIRLIHDPFHATTLDRTPPLPCPTTQVCAQEAPSYSDDGRLVYLAQAGSRSCWFATCPTMTYNVVRYDGTHTSVLVSQGRPPGLVVQGTVNPTTSAVIFTLPERSGRAWSVWRWSGGAPVTIPPPGGTATDPTW